jgi:hypothetical protein
MKKLVLITIFVLSIIVPTAAFADVNFNSAKCYPGHVCLDANQDPYGPKKQCQHVISSLADCTAQGDYNSFSCELGCYKAVAAAASPSCPKGIVNLKGTSLSPTDDLWADVLPVVLNDSIAYLFNCRPPASVTQLAFFWLAGTTAGQIYYSGGNVGIGTNNPSAPLEVSGRVSQIGLGNSTFFGQDAGKVDDATNNYNVGLGLDSLLNNTSGYENTALGTGSLLTNTTGYDNTSAGYEGLTYNTTGNYNTAVGGYGLYKNTTGSYNNANGYRSLYTNTTGGYNSALGVYSLNANTTASGNTAVGYAGLYYNTTGSYNSALGYASLYGNTTGIYNSGLGYESLFSNKTGNYNTAIGWKSLFSNTAADNTALGKESLYSNTTGISNTAVGEYSLYSNTTANNNTAIGFRSGEYIADGTSANSTSSSSVYVGNGTKASANGDTNEIVIGDTATGAGSNSVVLGNDSITSTLLKGNVGIGTTANPFRLSVSSGTAKTSTTETIASWISTNEALASNPFGLYTSILGAATNAARTAILQTSNYGTDTLGNISLQPWGGNVGIGTATPNSKLEVKGGDVTIDGGYYNKLNIISDNYWSGIEIRTLENSTAGNPHIDFSHGDAAAINYGIRLAAPDNDSFYITGGNVGIKDTTPSYDLDVTGSIRATTNIGAGTTPVSGNGVTSYGSTAGGYFYDTTMGASAYLAASDTGVFGFGGLQGGYFGSDTIIEGIPLQARLAYAKPTSDGYGASGLYGLYTQGGQYGLYSSAGTWAGYFLNTTDLTDAYLGYSTGGKNYSLYGNGIVRGIGAYVNGSDARLKKNVVTIENALNKVMQLRGVEFNWIDKKLGDDKQYGFIAQEVEKIAPQLVIPPEKPEDLQPGDEVGKYYGMEYGNVTALLTNAIQELKHEKDGEINQLREENKVLREFLCTKYPDAKFCNN